MWFLGFSLAVGGAALSALLANNGTPLHVAVALAYGDQPGSHDLYNPARTALVNARRQLAETFRQEQDIQVQRERVHRELAESLKLLENAEQLDQAMKAPIEDLKQRIAALDQDPCGSRHEGKSLEELYDELLADFEALIAHY
jgi:chromosome segregation ATPase